MNETQRLNFTLGQERLSRGETDAAIHSFCELTKNCPQFADVHYWTGLAFEQQGNLFAAARSLETAIELNPAYVEALMALACVYEQQGNFEKASVLANRAQSATNPTTDGLDRTTRGKLANLQAGLGDAYREVGELREAVDAYRKALYRCPEFHDIRIRLATTLRDLGLPDQAIQELQRVLRQQPESQAAARQLALTYYTIGKVENAVAEWEKLLAKDPECREAKMYLDMIAKLDVDQRISVAS